MQHGPTCWLPGPKKHPSVISEYMTVWVYDVGVGQVEGLKIRQNGENGAPERWGPPARNKTEKNRVLVLKSLSGASWGGQGAGGALPGAWPECDPPAR